MTTNTAIERIKSYAQSGKEIRQSMGDVIFWRLDAARVDRATLINVWKSGGMLESLLPEEPTPEKALKRAIQENQTGLKDLIIRKTLENDTRIIFAVVRENRIGNGDSVYHQEAKIILDRKARQISIDNPGHEVASQVMTDYRTLLNTHTADDVRKAVTNAIHSMAAVTLRDGGGVYWIPQPYADLVRNMAKAIQNIGGSKVFLLPISAAVESEEALIELAQGSLEAELNKLQEEIKGFINEPPARLSTLSNRLDTFKELRSRANLYKMVLSTEVSGLEENLQKMEKQVESMIHNKMTGK